MIKNQSVVPSVTGS